MKKHTQIDESFLEMIKANDGLIYKVASFYADQHPISDLYQETVLNLWRAYPSFRGESKQSTWIYRIALNTCVSFFRKNKKAVFVDITADIPDEASTNEDIKQLYIMINKLAKPERALVLLYLEDKTYKEIAEITGLSLTNVSTKLSRIKDKLRQMSNE